MTAALPNRIPNDSARYRSGDPRQRLIVALDVSTAAAAQKIVAAVGDSALTYKVGMQLYTAAGPQVVRDLVAAGRRVFLDLKYHDIPNTVGAAVAEAEKLGVNMLTVHAVGSVMRAAVAARAGSNLRILGVTVLTSFGPEDMDDLGYQGTSLRHPHRKPPKGKLTPRQRRCNRRLSRRRVAAEHAIGTMKVWRIAADRYRNPLRRHTLAMKNVAGLHNMMYA